ncbi:response regulator transcription factor [Nemorincola caseinilytica]|uniref:Response regulator transcription factor n=1 Tax=Nemorincola caseinilytica TaxID=2054315 RepID=A0ABP8N5F7_9BACT
MSLRSAGNIRNIVIYGISLAALLLLLSWLQWRLLIIDHATDIYIGAIALLFTGLGIWLALKIMRPKKETVIIEKEIYITQPAADPSPTTPSTDITNFTINEQQLQKLGISAREMDVLQLMAKGLSNQEIAERLYVSLNTIKTHSSNLFLKLDVKRRTQAVDQARKLGLIP